MILIIGNIKGGVGKSTIACNIAVALTQMHPESSVLLIDGDKQGSASDFTQSRAGALDTPGYSCVRAQGAEVRTQVKEMRDKFTHIIIDAGGQDNPSLRAGLIAADTVLIPISPRSFETWALDSMADLLEEAQSINESLKAFGVINMAFPRGSDNLQTQEIIRDDYKNLTLVNSVIVQRKIFSDMAGQGLSIFEAKKKDLKATDEFLAVMHELGLH